MSLRFNEYVVFLFYDLNTGSKHQHSGRPPPFLAGSLGSGKFASWIFSWCGFSAPLLFESPIPLNRQGSRPVAYGEPLGPRFVDENTKARVDENLTTNNNNNNNNNNNRNRYI